MIEHKDWKWFGRPGHFICADSCRFHLCTQIGKYLISTVGEYIPPMHNGELVRDPIRWMQEHFPGAAIGWKRTYETMVFEAAEPCIWDKCQCGQPDINPTELECNGYNLARDAIAGHMELCVKYAEMQ